MFWLFFQKIQARKYKAQGLTIIFNFKKLFYCQAILF